MYVYIYIYTHICIYIYIYNASSRIFVGAPPRRSGPPGCGPSIFEYWLIMCLGLVDCDDCLLICFVCSGCGPSLRRYRCLLKKHPSGEEYHGVSSTPKK